MTADRVPLCVEGQPLCVEGLSKRYQKHAVLHDVSLSLTAGEIFGLVGLNGAGKTTLIKSIVDLHRAEKGTIQLFGEPSTASRSRQQVHYLPEKFQPSPSLTGYEFLLLSQQAYGLPNDRQAADKAAEKLGFKPEYLARKIKSYSKGMGQKIGLMSILLCQRSLLILDEPMSGLDPEARAQLRDALLEYRAAGHTIFFSSHILSDIEAMCDRIGVIHAGRLLFTGTVQAFMKEQERSTLEAAFLTSIGSPAA